MVIVLDNCSVYYNDQIKQVIQHAGHLVEYLPPYSPDFNPIELTFSVLKAWVRRYFWLRRVERSNFGEFLRLAVNESRCDRFTGKQFRHTVGGVYIEKDEYEKVYDNIRDFMSSYTELEWEDSRNTRL